MRRTRPTTLVALALLGGVGGFLLQLALGSVGQPKLRAEFTLSITLLLFAIVVVALAVPVRRATRGKVRRRIDPFYATRVVVLAKASALAGALLTGAALGFLVELLARAGAPTADSFARVLTMLGASVALLVAGLVAEFLCTVPPDDPDNAGPRAPARDPVA